jgi:hypothetical protein
VDPADIVLAAYGVESDADEDDDDEGIAIFGGKSENGVDNDLGGEDDG